MKTARHKSHVTGFTLIEVMIALLLMSMIIGLVFGIARSSLNLGKAIIDSQGKEMEQQAFFDLLSRRFSSLPGNARLDIKVEEQGNQYLSDFTLQNVPMSFTWGGQDLLARSVQLSTVKQRSGFLNIVLRYYENEILEGSAADFGSTTDDEEPFAEIVLLRDVAYFEWRVLNSTTMEWEYEWADAQRVPLQIELVMATGAEGKSMRYVFWLPPKQNPEMVMRQLQPSASPTSPTPKNPGDVSIEVNLPPNQGGDQ